MKTFANPNCLWVTDETYEAKIKVSFSIDDGGPFAHVEVWEAGHGGEGEEGSHGLITRFDLDMDTIKIILDSGWHFGVAPPPEWNLDGEEGVPPGTTVH